MCSTSKDSPSIAKLPFKEPLLPLQLETLRNPSTSSDTEEKNPNPNSIPNNNHNPVDFNMAEKSSSSLMTEAAEEDRVLSKSEFLTREEVIRRRSRRAKKLVRCYRDHYWDLMEELKLKYREYYWKYGKSPFNEEEERVNGGVSGVEGSGDSGSRPGLGFGESNGVDGKINGGNNRCAFLGCKSKPMALTSYCHPHILSDSKQKLYKACTFVIKSSQTGPILCGKPILRSTVPSLCTAHFQKAQKHVTRALKKAGLNISSSSKLAPKFHVVVAESVHQIQAKRRAARRAIKEENNFAAS